MPAFITNAVQVQRFADAMYNVAVGTSTMAQVTADITASGGLDNALNAYYTSSFAGVSTTTIAANMCANLGIVAGSNGLVAADVTVAQNYIVGTLNAAAANARGAAVKGILNNLASLTSDKVYGAVATKFNSDIDNAVSNPSAGDVTAGTIQPAPSSFTLSTSVDNRTGTVGADTFNGIADGTTVTNTTINAGDSLNGGDGVDTLSITAMGAATALSGVTTNNIEKLQIQTVQTGATSFDALLTTGITEVTAIGSSQALTVSNLATIPTLNVNQGNANVTLSYRATSVTSGTADKQTINVNGDATSSALTIAAPGIEQVTLNSTGATSGTATQNITLTDSSLQTLTVNASAALFATTTLSGATSATQNGVVDASGSTANVNLTVTAGANNSTSITGGAGNDLFAVTPGSANVTVNGGAGNDTIRIDGSTLSRVSVISGGDGTDTLQLTAAANITSAANGVGISGIESVQGFRNTTAAAGVGITGIVVAQDMSLLPAASQPTSIGVSSWAESSDTASTPTDGVNFTNLTAATTDLNISGITFTNAAAAGAGTAHTVGFTATAALLNDTPNDSLNVTLGTSTAAAARGIVTNTGGGTTTVNLNVAVDNYENVTLTSNGAAGNTNTIASLAGARLTNLTIGAGSAALTVTATGAALSNLATINATAATTDTNLSGLTMGTARGVTITGGSGNDSYKGTTVSDNIDGGAGNDSIVGSNGNDTLSGGAGNDTVTGGTGNDVLNGGDGDDSITGGGGNDNMSGNAGNDTFIISVTGSNTMGLSSTVTVNGGDGIDAIRLTGTATGGAVALNFSPSTETRFTNTSVEVIEIGSLQNAAAEQTVGIQLGDIAMGNFANTITIRTQAGVTGGQQTIDSSGILNTSSRVNYTGQSGVINNYTVGNNVDNVTLGSQADIVTVSNPLFLQATDTINGGLGSDSISIASGSTNVALSTATLANVSSFETVTANFATGTTGNLSFTLSDAFASNNRDSATSALTVGVTEGGGTGTLTVNGSAVTGTGLILNSSTRADTLTGGAGNDVFVFALNTAISGESITGGDGTDVIRFTDNNSLNGITLTTIEGIQFGVPGANTGAVTLSANAATLSGQTFTVAEVDTSDSVNVIALTANGLATIDLSKITATAASDGSTFAATNDQVTISFTGNADANLAHTYTGSGLADQITNAANTVSDTLIGGAGNDNFIYATDAGGGTGVVNVIANNAFIDSISGGSGTADTITITGTNAITIANTVSWTNVNTVEVLALGSATQAAVSITPAASAWTAGIRTITFALDTDATTGADTVDASSQTSTTIGLTFIGSAGIDNITGGAGNDAITGGAGADVIVTGTGVDTVNIAATGDTGAVTNWTVANPGVQSTTTLDKITVSAGDLVNIGAGAITFTAFGGVTTAAVDGLLTVSEGSAGTFKVYTGAYSAGGATFTSGNAGGSVLVVWDTNGTTAGNTYNAVVLVGVDTVTSISTAGLITV